MRLRSLVTKRLRQVLQGWPETRRQNAALFERDRRWISSSSSSDSKGRQQPVTLEPPEMIDQQGKWQQHIPQFHSGEQTSVGSIAHMI